MLGGVKEKNMSIFKSSVSTTRIKIEKNQENQK